MKKIAVLVVVVAVFFASSGPIMACELCERLGKLGYTNFQIAQIIRSSANRAEAETRMRQIIAEGRPIEVKHQQPQQPRRQISSQVLAADNQGFRFSNEVIQVPPDIERR